MYIVFDIGGTKIRVARSDDGIALSQTIILDTPESFKEGSALVVKCIRELAKRKRITAIAGGIPGVLNRETGMLYSSPNLRGWENHSLKERLLKICPQVYIENDAALVGLGESIYGAGKDYEIVAYITVSTGIGGARIVQEMIDLRRVSFEPGQQIIDKENLTSLENLSSGRAVQKRYGKHPKDITDEQVWKKAAENLAIGLHNTILHWSPDVVVLGGPMIVHKPGIDINYVREYLKSIMIMFPSIPDIKLAELKDSGGLYGSLAFIRQQKAQDPSEVQSLY